MENFSQATDAAAAAMDSQGSAVSENEKRLESFESKINNIKGAWQEVVLEFVNSEKVKDILDKVNDGLRDLANNKGAVNTITDIVEAFVYLQGAKLGAGVFQSLVSSLWSVITKIKDLRAGILLAGTATSTMGATLSAVGLTLSSLITPATVFLAVMTAIGGAIVLYKKYQQAPTEQLEKDKQTLEETKDTYKKIIKEHDELLDRQKDLKSQGLDLNKAEKKRLEILEKQTKELEEQEKKQKEKIASDTVGTLKYTQQGTKTVHKQGSTFNIPTKEILKGQEAFEAISKAIADATEQYKNGEITLTEYENKTGELNTQLDSVYDSYLDVINSGGDLNEQDTKNYNTLVNLKVAWVNAQGASSNYAKALKSVSTDVKQSIYITDTFKESLVRVGGKYYFISQAAKDSAMKQLKTEMALTNSVVEQVSNRISARMLEYDSIKDFNQKFLNQEFTKHLSPTAAGQYYENFYNSKEGQEVQKYYKFKSILNSLKKIKVKGSGLDDDGGNKTPSPNNGSGKGSGKSDAEKKKKDKEEKEKKDAQARLKRYKKWLENYEATQREYYQKGIISASEYYSNVQKKGEYYYNLLKKRGKNYASAASSMWSEYKDKNSEAVKELFSEIDYRYEEGKISGQEYYKELWKYAKKFYKNGKLDFSEYRDYVNKGYKAMFDDIKKQYDNGEITAEQYLKKVKKAEKNANASITSARKKGTITKSTASSTRNDLTRATVDALNEAAQALKEAAIKAAEAAVEAAEKKLKEAQARQDKANTFISALQFYASEQQELIDKEIDGYNEQIDALNEKLSLMEEQNEALDKQAERMKLVKELEEAKKQKTVRVYDSRLGWVA